MARGTGTNIRMLLIGACVFSAGYGSGQVIAPASAARSQPTVSVPVPTVSIPVPAVSVPVPAVSVPAPPTVPTLPTSSAPPPTISLPTPDGPPPVAETLRGSQTPLVSRTRYKQSPSTATRVQTASFGGGRRSRAAPDRRHTATLRSGVARASRPRPLTNPRALVPSGRLRAPASSRRSSSRAQHNDPGS